ncbi:MAG: cytochrome c peroxidase [Bacteroidota bacterium]
MKTKLNRLTYPLLGFLILLSGCNQNNEEPFEEVKLDNELLTLLHEADPDLGVEGFMLPDPESLAELPQDPRNPITPEKVALGRMLFHETALATEALKAEGMLTYSCASCHNPKAAMQSGRRQGIAEGGSGFGLSGESREKNPVYLGDEVDAQPIRVPSTLNVAYQKNLLWNGMFGATGLNAGTEALWTGDASVNLLGFEGAESQAIKGLEVHRMNADYHLLDQMGYMSSLRNAFPGVADDTLTSRVYMGLAIAAYVRTITTYEAPFQQWLRGNRSALNDQQKQGAILFFGKANCVNCHAGPGLNNMEFAAVGMEDLSGPDIFRADVIGSSLGRGGFTGNTEDNFKFKVPQLYNLKDAPFYGHGSSFDNLEDVIQYFNLAEPQNTINPFRLDERFEPLGLSDEEVQDLLAFVRDGLYDANLDRHIPQAILSNQCFPNADEVSKVDLGCN